MPYAVATRRQGLQTRRALPVMRRGMRGLGDSTWTPNASCGSVPQIAPFIAQNPGDTTAANNQWMAALNAWISCQGLQYKDPTVPANWTSQACMTNFGINGPCYSDPTGDNWMVANQVLLNPPNHPQWAWTAPSGLTYYPIGAPAAGPAIPGGNTASAAAAASSVSQGTSVTVAAQQILAAQPQSLSSLQYGVTLAVPTASVPAAGAAALAAMTAAVQALVPGVDTTTIQNAIQNSPSATPAQIAPILANSQLSALQTANLTNPAALAQQAAFQTVQTAALSSPAAVQQAQAQILATGPANQIGTTPNITIPTTPAASVSYVTPSSNGPATLPASQVPTNTAVIASSGGNPVAVTTTGAVVPVTAAAASTAAANGTPVSSGDIMLGTFDLSQFLTGTTGGIPGWALLAGGLVGLILLTKL